MNSMRLIVLASVLAFPVSAIAYEPLPEHEGTHFYRVEDCGRAIGVLIVTEDGAYQISRIVNRAQLAEMMGHRRDAIEGGYAARVEQNPDCQNT